MLFNTVLFATLFWLAVQKGRRRIADFLPPLFNSMSLRYTFPERNPKPQKQNTPFSIIIPLKHVAKPNPRNICGQKTSDVGEKKRKTGKRTSEREKGKNSFREIWDERRGEITGGGEGRNLWLSTTKEREGGRINLETCRGGGGKPPTNDFAHVGIRTVTPPRPPAAHSNPTATPPVFISWGFFCLDALSSRESTAQGRKSNIRNNIPTGFLSGGSVSLPLPETCSPTPFPAVAY